MVMGGRQVLFFGRGTGGEHEVVRLPDLGVWISLFAGINEKDDE